MSEYGYKQQKPPSNVKAVLVAITCTVIIICVALLCMGAFMDDDSKKKSQVAPTETWLPTRVPDGGTRPTKGGTPSKSTKTSAPKVTKTSTAKPTVKVTKTSTPKPTVTTTKPSTPKPTATTKPPVKSYDNCTELRRDYPSGVPAGHPAYQKKMDRDNDGFACETS